MSFLFPTAYAQEAAAPQPSLTYNLVLFGGMFLLFYLILWRRLSRIGKLANDPDLKFKMGVCKSAVLAYLVLGLATEHFLQVTTWGVLAAMIGYSYSLEGSLHALRAKPKPMAITPRVG